MSIDACKAKIPDYAKDIKLNLSNLLGGIESTQLSKAQIAGLALAAAYATEQKTAIQLLNAFAQQQALSEQTMQGIKAAAAVMAMNNIYYRSMHWIQDDTYKKLPPNLRMHMLQKHGIDNQDFELYCVVISAINGCERCLDAHVATLAKSGVGTAEIHYSLRVAAVIRAFAQVIAIEEAAVQL